jgi:hypothetical protein
MTPRYGNLDGDPVRFTAIEARMARKLAVGAVGRINAAFKWLLR